MYPWTSSPTIDTFAGTGNPGFSPDGSAATATEFYQVRDVWIDGLDNVYIAESAGSVRKVTNSTGLVSTIATFSECHPTSPLAFTLAVSAHQVLSLRFRSFVQA